MLKIKTALISVSDKTGIVEFSKELKRLGIEILSTGGTARLLKENNVLVTEVSDYTGFPEILDGRVKTLHPKIHAGLLALRDNLQHMQVLEKYKIKLIDMVVVNLYPFEKVIQNSSVDLKEVIENIDIGGPAMLRSAAKNYRSVAVVCNPDWYPKIIEELKKNQGLSEEILEDLAIEAFNRTSSYDSIIYSYLNNFFGKDKYFPKDLVLSFEKVQNLRYGENPHQQAAFYKEKIRTGGFGGIKQIQGKELSFNNLLDLEAAFSLVKEFEEPAAAIIKHNNPCGVAEDKALDKAYRWAFECDPLSAFGGIVALNREIDLKTARVILKSGFLECIIAPGFSSEALSLFRDKKNLRIIELNNFSKIEEWDLKRISGGLLLQERDLEVLKSNDLRVVTKTKPTQKQLRTLIFAFKVCKHVKSNAIVLAKGSHTVGIGAGQMSRLDSVIIALKKAAKSVESSCLASDAFFPKEDAVLKAIKAGISAIIQPGGSIADEKIIEICNRYKIPMIFTGIRHFKH
ncbi:MAG: bifunctional phosphoribosylaminoimidazolecarboxamide formyltransferase/IMP cyclohydrolase [Candidatus Omnitrophica bacterium]|nr:bifunctional phosphoribosylaminoimidazolecarboxamide formyltransferase/IMP cyclohydrolase [Candidatus Omnitrophota bacterium]